MELFDEIENEFHKMLGANETQNRQSLHTQIPKTGYQPYGQHIVGSVAETNSYGPVVSSRSRSSSSGKSSGQSSLAKSGVLTDKRRGSESNLLESGSVALTAPEGSQSSSSGDKRRIFTEAEQKIIEKGLEVATKAAELQRVEHCQHKTGVRKALHR